MSATAKISASDPAQNLTQDMVHNMILGQLYTNEVIDTRILQAIADTPREAFVPDHLKKIAYVDDNLNMGGGRFLLSPLTFARLLSLAGITPQCRVLDVGCLTGYSTAVLSKLAAHIVAIDTDAQAIAQAKTHLKEAQNVDIETVTSLADGYGMSAPYDVIIIEGAINFVPDDVGLQLSEGGRLVTVFCRGRQRELVFGSCKGALIRRLEGSLQYREHFDAAASLLPGFARETGFTL